MKINQFIFYSSVIFLLCICPVWASSCSSDESIDDVTQPEEGDNNGNEEVDTAEFVNNCQLIMERIKANNLSDNVANIEKNATEWMGQIQENGAFPDINYADHSYAFTPMAHLKRLNYMVQAYIHEESSLYGDENLYQLIVKALTYWNTVHPVCDNWYGNQISVPQDMGVMLVLLRFGKERIPQELEDSILKYMTKTGGNPASQSGANKTDIALHWLYRGCLQQDPDVVNHAVYHTFFPLSYVSSSSEGIQYDLSYFQHGAQLYIGGYSPVMLTGVTLVASYTAGTQYKLSQNQLQILYKYINESYMKSIRGNTQFYNVVGRSVSRTGALNCIYFVPKLEMMKQIDPAHISEYEQHIQTLNGGDYSFVTDNFKHFYIGDWSLYQGKDYSISVRMASTRTRRCENGNDENLKSYFMSDGSMDIATDGGEYLGIFPVWNWSRVPGVTCPQLSDIPLASAWGEKGESDFCGGVSAGQFGLSGFKMISKKHGIDVSGNKSYFFLEGRVVCLGSAITSSMTATVNTTVNQCLLNGNITYSLNGTETAGTAVNDQSLDWVHHGNVGYFFPSKQKVSIQAIQQTGTWNSINLTQSSSVVSKNVCSIWLNHGKRPTSADYCYVIVPNLKSAAEMKSYDISNTQIIVNSADIQAVKDVKNNIIQAMFYKSGSITTADGLTLSVDKPCAIMLKINSNQTVDVYTADPSHKLLNVNVKIECKEFSKSVQFNEFNANNDYKGCTFQKTI